MSWTPGSAYRRPTWTTVCDLVLPCRDEAAALAGAAAAGAGRLPRDRRRQRLERRHRRGRAPPRAPRSSREPGPGTAPPCTPGWWPPPREYVAFMDGDGSFDPADLLAAARRRPVRARRPGGRSPAPGRPRCLAVARPRRQRAGRLAGCAAGSACPRTTSRRCGSAAATALLDLGVRDRAFGYPVELLQKATVRRLAVRRARRRLPPARRGHPVQGVRLGARHVAGRPRLLAGARVTLPGCWSSPRRRCAGRVKTRLGADDRHGRAAAELAAAALLDTLAACDRRRRRRTLPPRAGRRPRRGRPRRPSCRRALAGWTVLPQRGDGFGERLADAHARRRRRARSSRSAWTPRR